MDIAAHLRHHSRVVERGGKPLVSVGKAFRFRKQRERDLRRLQREFERAQNDPDEPGLTAIGRARRLAALAEQKASR